MAITATCTACNVTTQRPYESRAVCPRCDHVELVTPETTLSGIPRAEGEVPESPAQDVRNALQLLLNLAPVGTTGVSSSAYTMTQDDFQLIIDRLWSAVRKLESQ